jgi:hypothetical protein
MSSNGSMVEARAAATPASAGVLLTVLILIGVLLTIALLVAAPAAHADLSPTSTCTWTGAVSPIWSELGDWDSSGMPADGVVKLSSQNSLAESATSGIAPAAHTIQALAPATGVYLGQLDLPIGSGEGQPRCPTGAAVAANGDVYVVDEYNCCVQYFSASGAYKGQWGAPGSGPGEFQRPEDVAIAPNGNVYVTDWVDCRVQYFSATGGYLGEWGKQDSGPGELFGPMGLDVAPNGDVYVVDSRDDRVKLFGATGEYKGQWGSSGSADGQFEWPAYVAIAPNGDVYVTDWVGSRVLYFSAAGVYKGQWGGAGTGNGQFGGPQHIDVFRGPRGIDVAANGDVYVSDSGNDRVQYFTAAGAYKGQWGRYGTSGWFASAAGIALTPAGIAHVCDAEIGRVQYFGAHGTVSPSGIVTADAGSTPTFSFTPDERSHVKEVRVDDRVVEMTGENSYTFAEASEDHVISVEFAIDRVIVTPSVLAAYGRGTISPDLAQMVDCGATPTFTFRPETGYRVNHVRVDNKVVEMTGENSYTFPALSEDHTISVEFGIYRPTIKPSVVNGRFFGNGDISPDVDQTVDYGATPTFTFTPRTDYHVEEVRVDDRVVEMTGENSYTFPAVSEDHTISVRFVHDRFTITPSVVGGASGHGTISPDEDQTVDYCAEPTFTFEPETGYDVKEVRVDDRVVEMTGENSYTFPEVVEDHTIIVEFAIHKPTIRALAPASGVYLGQWSLPRDPGDGEPSPQGVAVAANGDVYVVDQYNRRIQYFSATGAYKGQWGTIGSRPGEFREAHAVAIAPNGDVYVTDPTSNRVQYFSATGAYKGQWGSQGSGPGQFEAAFGLAIAPNGDVYVADLYNNRVQHFGATGEYKGAWGSAGSGDGQFTHPRSVAVAPTGDVYVTSDNRVQYFTATGVYKGQWGSLGTGDGQFLSVHAVAVAPNGDVYTVEYIGQRVQRFGATGAYKGQWGSQGAGDGQFESPEAIAVAPDGRVYVSDLRKLTIQYFGARGTISPSGAVTAASGSTPSFSLNPDEGCHVAAVYVNGVAVTPRPTGEYTFAPVTADHTFSVEFAVDLTLTPVVVSDPAYGTIDPGTPQIVDYGTFVRVTFTPDTDCYIKEVKVDGTVISPAPTSLLVGMGANRTVSVEFAIRKYMMTVLDSVHGRIEPGTSVVDIGSSRTYTITPDEGYHIVDVVADGRSVGAVPSVTFQNILESHVLSATFAVDTFDITPSVVGTPAHGTITPASTTSVDWHSTPTFTFAPEQGYEVDEVRVDGQPVAMTGTDEYTFPSVTAVHAISVSFKQLTYMVTVTAGAHGSVTPGSGPVAWGSTPEYAITPDEGFAVADVLVDGASVGAVTSYQFAAVTAGHTLAASFVAEGMPWASVEGASSGWSKRPVRLTFSGHAGEGGVPVARTEYKLGDGDWVEGSSVTVSAEGETEVAYRAVDEAGTVQDPAGHCLVRVDTKRPRVVARSASTRQGTGARLRYMVSDPRPSCGQALLRAVVTHLGGGRALTRASSVPVTVNEWHALRIKTGRLSPGTYLVTLRAMDKAGNFQRGVTHVRLTIQ